VEHRAQIASDSMLVLFKAQAAPRAHDHLESLDPFAQAVGLAVIQ
jgi:hypothetical protein